MSKKRIKLPLNGSWIDAATISKVLLTRPGTIAVHFWCGHVEVIRCDDQQTAQAVADRIAAECGWIDALADLQPPPASS